MRRFLSAALALLLASGMVLVAGPAFAIEVPPPPPVSESPYTSTQLQRTSSSPFVGGPLTDQQKVERAYRYQLLTGTNTAGAVDAPNRAPQPIAPPKALTRVAAGAGILGAGVLVVPVLVQGGIKMMGISAEVGNQPYDAIICGSIGSTNDGGFMEWLYGDNECYSPITLPNSDTPVGVMTFPSGVSFTQHTATFACGGGCTRVVPVMCSAAGVSPLTAPLVYRGTGSNGLTVNVSNILTSGNGCGTTADKRLQGVQATAAWEGHSYIKVELYNTSTGAVTATANANEPDPLRSVECEVEWSNGAITRGTASAYRESEGFPISEVDCQGAYDNRPAEDAYPVGISIDSNAGGSDTRLAEFDVPADLEDPQPGRGLRLEKTVDGAVLSCMTWEASCVGWWAATDEGTLTTSPYRCMFGEAEISLTECGLYRHTFDEKTDTPTITDPVTGEEIQWHTSPDGRNSTNPGTGPTPGEDCLNNWPSIADPISWVLHPVKCALVWAFVPRTSEVERLTGELTSMWEDTGVGLTVNTITAWEFAAPTSGCGGVLVPMSTIFEHGVEDFRLLDACAGSPLQQTAVWSYWIILIASIINLIASISRNVGSVVGARGVAEGDD